jgi:hypothetical protein
LSAVENSLPEDEFNIQDMLVLYHPCEIHNMQLSMKFAIYIYASITMKTLGGWNCVER